MWFRSSLGAHLPHRVCAFPFLATCHSPKQRTALLATVGLYLADFVTLYSPFSLNSEDGKAFMRAWPNASIRLNKRLGYMPICFIPSPLTRSSRADWVKSESDGSLATKLINGAYLTPLGWHAGPVGIERHPDGGMLLPLYRVLSICHASRLPDTPPLLGCRVWPAADVVPPRPDITREELVSLKAILEAVDAKSYETRSAASKRARTAVCELFLSNSTSSHPSLLGGDQRSATQKDSRIACTRCQGPQ